MLALVLSIVAILAVNLLWQDTVGSMHPLAWIGTLMGMYVVFHFIIRGGDALIDRWRRS